MRASNLPKNLHTGSTFEIKLKSQKEVLDLTLICTVLNILITNLFAIKHIFKISRSNLTFSTVHLIFMYHSKVIG